MKSIIDIVKDNVPDMMIPYEYVKIDTILDKPIRVECYCLFESKSAKYTEDNKIGVHIGFVDSEGNKKRICTHAMTIVRVFKTIDEDDSIDYSIPIKMVKIQTKNGFSYTFDSVE